VNYGDETVRDPAQQVLQRAFIQLIDNHYIEKRTVQEYAGIGFGQERAGIHCRTAGCRGKVTPAVYPL